MGVRVPPRSQKNTLSNQQADGSYLDIEYYLIEKIIIQDIELYNVVFAVYKKGGSNLIGNDFWNKFSKKFPPNDGKIKVVK